MNNSNSVKTTNQILPAALWLTLKKCWQTMKMSWMEYLSYRLNFCLQVIGPGLVFYFVKYSLWSTLFSTKTIINGMTIQTMLAYQSWVFVIDLISQGHASIKLSDDIRLGRISTHLVYPFSFWQYHFSQFLAFQMVQLLVAAVTFSIFLVNGMIAFPSINSLLCGLLMTSYVSLFWFLMQYAIGLLSFWLDQTWVMRVLLTIIANFLSGAIIPLTFYPPILQKFLTYTPFPALSYIPITIFMRADVPYRGVFSAFFILTAWMLGVLGLTIFIWRKGLKLYTGSGM